MSTVHETIAARAAGMEVLGISLVVNLAAGITGGPLSHEEVLQSGRDAGGRVGMLLAGIVFALANTIPDTPVRNILGTTSANLGTIPISSATSERRWAPDDLRFGTANCAGRSAPVPAG